MSEVHQPITGYPLILPAGDQAVIIEFGDEISPAINDGVYALADRLTSAAPAWLREMVPTYRSLLVGYDAFEFDYADVISELSGYLASFEVGHDGYVGETGTAKTSRAPLVYELPVAYGGESGPDLENVAEHAGLTTEEVIKIHSSVAYRVYMIGFSPGFPYLGGMDSRIACPRLATPRTRVPAGSVGIAESQTGVYPNASPGGWQLIGQTPVRLFNVNINPPSLLQPGHFVRFVPVSPEEMSDIERLVELGEYNVKSTRLSE
jgi:inhibitor of KinA